MHSPDILGGDINFDTAVKPVRKVRNPDTPILFVDDEQTAHLIIRNHLQDWLVESAFSAEEAIQIIHRKHILIVITDIRMPGMDGISLLREVRKNRGIIQGIIVTASNEIDDLIDAFEAGASDFLLKPLEKKDIEEALESAVTKLNRWKTRMKELFTRRKEVKTEMVFPLDDDDD